MSLYDKPHSEYPTTFRMGENVVKVDAIELEDRWRTIEDYVIVCDWFFHNVNAPVPYQFLAKTAWPLCSMPFSPYHMTLLCATLFCSHEQRGIWKDIILITWKSWRKENEEGVCNHTDRQVWTIFPTIESSIRKVYKVKWRVQNILKVLRLLCFKKKKINKFADC